MDIDEGREVAREPTYTFEKWIKGKTFWQNDAENKTLGELGWKGHMGLAVDLRRVQ